MATIEQVARRRLDAARLTGSAALALLGQFAVDAPEGYFGPTDQMTPVGGAFLALVLVLFGLSVTLRLAGRRLFVMPALAQVGIILVAFVPPLASDPVVSGVEVLWHLLLFARFVFEERRSRPRTSWHPVGEATAINIWTRRNGPAEQHLLVVSLAVAVAVLGYGLGERVPAQLICLTLGAIAVGLAAPFLLLRFRLRSMRAVLVGLLLIAAAASFRIPELALSLLAIAQVVILLLLWMETRLATDLLESFYRRPAYLVLTSFMILIALGTMFLSFPGASAGGSPVEPLDALFTATSASCVTGLIVLDTPKDFSTFGLVVILVLIQLGGLNIMVLSAFAAVLLGRGLGLRGEGALGNVLDLQPGRSVRRLVVFIVVGTLACEASGSILLAVDYLRHGYRPLGAVWYGLFHAVSAFCNAGFSLHSDSLAGFRSDPFLLLVMATLITIGGLGFGVLAYFRTRLRSGRQRSPALQARLVLAASAVLVFVGALLFGLCEWNHSLAGLPLVDRVVNALFQSVTLRTAGFNSVGMEGLRSATILMMIAWMFIGASPGGTGGGIKTTTAAVLLGSVLTVLRRRNYVLLFRHRIPLDTVYRSAAIAAVAMLLVLGGAFALLLTQPLPFEKLLFETFSAFGTVGLSLGATSGLNGVGKAVVSALMLAGRVGPLTLALLLERRLTSRVSYPDARIMVG